MTPEMQNCVDSTPPLNHFKSAEDLTQIITMPASKFAQTVKNVRRLCDLAAYSTRAADMLDADTRVVFEQTGVITTALLDELLAQAAEVARLTSLIAKHAARDKGVDSHKPPCTCAAGFMCANCRASARKVAQSFPQDVEEAQRFIETPRPEIRL